MKTRFDREAFVAELPGWALRGVFCAATSAFWAVMMGFSSAAEIAGMVAGVACWVGIFAGLCVWLPGAVNWLNRDAAVALRWAAWIKVGLTAGGWGLFCLGGALNSDPLAQMGMLGTMDTALGMGALWGVSFMAGVNDLGLPALDSFGWTALTTVTEGALMALVIGAIAAALWILWRLSAATGVNWKFLRGRLTRLQCV